MNPPRGKSLAAARGEKKMKRVLILLALLLLLAVPASAASHNSILIRVGTNPPVEYVDWGSTYNSDIDILIDTAVKTGTPIYLVYQKDYPGTVRLYIEPIGYQAYISALEKTELYRRIGSNHPPLFPQGRAF